MSHARHAVTGSLNIEPRYGAIRCADGRGCRKLTGHRASAKLPRAVPASFTCMSTALRHPQRGMITVNPSGPKRDQGSARPTSWHLSVIFVKPFRGTDHCPAVLAIRCGGRLRRPAPNTITTSTSPKPTVHCVLIQLSSSAVKSAAQNAPGQQQFGPQQFPDSSRAPRESLPICLVRDIFFAIAFNHWSSVIFLARPIGRTG